MNKFLAAIALSVTLITGCASVPMESEEKNTQAKVFSVPAEGKSGIYVYRTSGVGSALKKSVWIDDNCLGETAQNVFFYEEVEGDAIHKVATESEFSNNELILNTESGKNYFVNQYIKMGVFVGGANLVEVTEDQGKREVVKLGLAVKGKCN